MSDVVTIWPPRRLDDLADVDPDILSAGTPPDFEFFYIDISSVRPGFIAVPETRIRFAQAPSRARKRISAGDVLMSSVRPNLQAFALFERTGGEYVASTGFAVIRPRDGNSGRFILHSLFSDNVTAQVRRLVVGSNYPAINTPDIAGLRLPTPDPAEQEAIAAVLDAVDDAITRTERVIAKLMLIKAGLLYDLLMRGIDAEGGVRSDASSSRMVPLSSVAEVNPPTASLGLPPDVEVSFVPMGDVSEDGHWVQRQTRPLSAIRAGFTPFREDDVLFAKITPCMENGKGMHAVNTMSGFGFASTEFHVLRAKNDNVARFVYWWTMMPSLRIKAAGRMTGSAGQQRVPADFFDWWLIPYRHPDEQQMIADRLDELESKIEAKRNILGKLHLVKQGIRHDVLTGRVRVPADLFSADAPLPVDGQKQSAKKANIYFMRSVLAAEIVEQMHEHATFGHVKFQKTLFLCERVAGLDLETRYHRAAAGPHDNRLMRSVDGQMEKQKWFRKVPRGVGADGKPVGWAYERMEKAGAHREWFEKYWAAARERIQRVIDMLRPLDTRRCEVVATLYSAWEDLLAAGREATDDAIVNEVLTNWHESKQAIPRETWIRALGWMRKQELQPATI